MSTILGPNGVPLVPVVKDWRITYAKDGETYVANPLDMLSAAARMLRDGWGLKRIFDELALIPGPKLDTGVLEQAIFNYGFPELDRRIASGQEPAESVTVEYEVAEDAASEELELGEPVMSALDEVEEAERQ